VEPPEPSDPESQQRPATHRASFVRLALVFYGAMFGVALLCAALSGDALLYASDLAELRGTQPVRDLAVGGLAAAIAILISNQWTAHTHSGERVARVLGALLGRLRWRDCLVLAIASGVGEEAFFRGVIQPYVGIVMASLIFGLAHLAPRRDLLPWTLFSVLAGFLLGGLFEATGNLIAPVVAHAGINLVNLWAITKKYGAGAGDVS